ncbi:unnamed protein product [Hermetia illucens]|uniref:Uncharacterized protein n=1 Tax=Hermetia illucens TaxID=343691 RepID=A0A7R8UGN4_HERIL|nr:unnamed protein product [Hermetia illucens]
MTSTTSRRNSVVSTPRCRHQPHVDKVYALKMDLISLPPCTRHQKTSTTKMPDQQTPLSQTSVPAIKISTTFLTTCLFALAYLQQFMGVLSPRKCSI